MKGKTVLICEDNETLLDMIGDIVESQEMKYLKCTNGAEALKALNENNVDLIISDVNMPKLNGIELLNKLNEMNSQIPLIFLTGQIDIATYRKGLTLGQFEFIRKPFQIEDIIGSIERALAFGKVKAPETNFREVLKKVVG